MNNNIHRFFRKHSCFSLFVLALLDLFLCLLVLVVNRIKPYDLTPTSIKLHNDYLSQLSAVKFSRKSPGYLNLLNGSVDNSSIINSGGSFLISGANKTWYAFYSVRSRYSRNNHIEVSRSTDQGTTWQKIGTALSDPHSLSSPWIAWDRTVEKYIMIPSTQKSQSGLLIYSTSKESFPFGWKLSQERFQRESQHHMNTVAILHDGSWWIFSAVKTYAAWSWPWFSSTPEESLGLRLFHTSKLLGVDWEEHPLSPISTDMRYVNAGGRPFIMDGALHRWALEMGTKDGIPSSHKLHLFKVETLNSKEYWEGYHQGIPPVTGDSTEGFTASHVDMQPLDTEGSWLGLFTLEQKSRFEKRSPNQQTNPPQSLKRSPHQQTNFLSFKLFAVQILISLSIGIVSWGGGGVSLGSSSLTQGVRHHSSSSSSQSYRSPLHRWTQPLRFIAVAASPEVTLTLMATFALFLSVGGFFVLPQAFYCPRWTVRVKVLPAPPVMHIDPSAPYDTSDLVIVTGATAGFFDRLTNMIGSVHFWEPGQKVIIYDLGFSLSQVNQMRCWRDIELRPFPFDDYSPIVRDVTNYAFKALAIERAMKSHKAVLWIDSGLELRGPMHTLTRRLARHGMVSALQEDSIGDRQYTQTRPMLEWFGLGHAWDKARLWQFCAGGLQGFVRGSDADRLILQPVVQCSLQTHQCLAPPGSSRDNHNFDQTAFTIAIWSNNFSCLPRETHCMWSVKKASRNPSQLSHPIEVVSRGHRLPKPYQSHVIIKQDCSSGILLTDTRNAVPQRESLSRHGFWFRVAKVYLQPIGDLFVMALACQGVHASIFGLFMLQLFVVGIYGRHCRYLASLHEVWSQDQFRLGCHLIFGSLTLLAAQFLGLHIASSVR